MLSGPHRPENHHKELFEHITGNWAKTSYDGWGWGGDSYKSTLDCGWTASWTGHHTLTILQEGSEQAVLPEEATAFSHLQETPVGVLPACGYHCVFTHRGTGWEWEGVQHKPTDQASWLCGQHETGLYGDDASHLLHTIIIISNQRSPLSPSCCSISTSK